MPDVCRQVYRELVAGDELPAGYATQDGVGLHEAVSILTGKRAWWVEPAGDGSYREQAVATRLLSR